MNEECPPPPPDRWARLAAEERRKQRRRDGCLILLLLLFVVAVLGLPIVPRGHGKKAATTQMVNNARQIGLALSEFETAYGKFPDASTIAEVKQRTGTTLTLDDATSNDLFKQLLATKLLVSEKVFAAFELNSKQPDDAFDKDSNALAAGECGFAYVVWPTSDEDPSRPLAFGPVIPGTRNIDLKINNGKVVVLRADNSCHVVPVNPQGRANLAPNNCFLHPAGSFWNGKPLEIKWPK